MIPNFMWVDVNDRLPELTEPWMGYNDANERVVLALNYEVTVLAYDPEKGIIKAKLDSTGWSEISSTSISSIVNITHWMYLPDKPKI